MLKLFMTTVLFSSLIWADLLAENFLRKYCLSQYKTKYLQLHTHKAFSYARDPASGKERCGWAYGYRNLQEAKEGALQQCLAYNIDAPCQIVDVDGYFFVPNNIFTTSVQTPTETLSYSEKVPLIEEAKKTLRGRCLKFFDTYLDKKEAKAFAYSLGVDRAYACGESFHYPNSEIAKKVALNSCKKNQIEQGIDAFQSPCKLYAQENNILLQQSDFLLEQTDKKQNSSMMSAPQKKTKRFSALIETLKNTAKILNNDLPKMLDKELRLDEIVAEGEKMIFNYTLVHFNKNTMSKERLHSIIYLDTKDQVCTDNDSVMMLKKGMLLDYIYRGVNKEQITNFFFDAQACGLKKHEEKKKKSIWDLLKKKAKTERDALYNIP